MKRHRFDPFSFAFGALFLIVGATFLLGGSGLRAARPTRLWPATIMVVGLSLAMWAMGRALHKEPAPAAAETDAGSADEGDQDEGPRP